MLSWTYLDSTAITEANGSSKDIQQASVPRCLRCIGVQGGALLSNGNAEYVQGTHSDRAAKFAPSLVEVRGNKSVWIHMVCKQTHEVQNFARHMTNLHAV